MKTKREMTIAEVRDLLEAEVFCGNDLSGKVEQASAADLMSDVLAQSKPGMLLLTGLTSPQVIRTAVVADLCAVVFVGGKRPGKEVLELSREEGITVLGTALTMFEAAGRLYGALSGK